jgi:hypothetical protein
MADTRTVSSGHVRTFSTRVTEGAERLVKAWMTQAKRPDRVGEFSYRGLELVHGGLGVAARSLSRLEKATQLPHRTERPQPPAHVQPPAKRARHTPAHAEPAHRGPGRAQHVPEPSTS